MDKLLTKSIINSVVRIEYRGKCVTATVICFPSGGKGLITVRHLFDDDSITGPVDMFVTCSPTPIRISGKVVVGDNCSDIALVILNDDSRIIGDATFQDIDMDGRNVIISDEFYIVGFPFVMDDFVYNTAMRLPDTGFPVGLIKHGYISGAIVDSGVRHYYLDIHNNKGFSGSPICYYEKDRYKIIGVISGFFNDKFDDYNVDPQSNSGIAYGTSIEHLYAALKELV